LFSPIIYILIRIARIILATLIGAVTGYLLLRFVSYVYERQKVKREEARDKFMNELIIKLNRHKKK
jgi:membrane protein YqaA with SNARE-associated domain